VTLLWSLKESPLIRRNREKTYIVLDSPNVEIVRKFDAKNNPQLLNGFLTCFVRTSFQVKIYEEKKIQHASLTVYGEEKELNFQHENKEKAEKTVINNYINKLCVEKHMTRRYLKY
jgi:hypothetical protein